MIREVPCHTSEHTNWCASWAQRVAAGATNRRRGNSQLKMGTTMTCHRQGSALKARLATGVPVQHTREDGVRLTHGRTVLT